MDDEQREIWFPAKRFGWGWSWPVAWQGWAVLLVYVVLLVLGIEKLQPMQKFVLFGYVTLITAALAAVCWWKGEKPRWRRRKRN